VILVDNGRMNCIEKGFGELLYCINCSACLDICPVYEEVGESFGVKHALARGLMLTAWLEGLEAIGDKLGMCLTCNLCFSICPSKINTGKLLPEFRRRIVNGSA
jgi:L-lactate dehydrogenase complex protein LldF